ncbi:MAG: hypothetical protein CO099_03645 [Bdellovibrio sp. CG_4_9_14_3_um_filter_39_7]|nr:MAG: hypothetical protein CO099_03645 [Bdellovibrio sp. CG_4_9_14_3_um_filter_39_7]
MRFLALFSIFFSTSLLACPDKSKRFWLEPKGTIKMEGCLSAEPYSVTVYKLGEIVFSRTIAHENDLKKIERDLAKNKKLKNYSDISPKLNKSYASEMKIQNQIFLRQLSLLDSLNQNLNLNPLEILCPVALAKATSKTIIYQDLTCKMEYSQENMNNSKDLIVTLRSDLLLSDNALLSQKTSHYTIEIKEKNGRIVNTGKCQTLGSSTVATTKSKKQSDKDSSFPDQSTISLNLDGKTKLPLDYTVKQTETNEDKMAVDLGLSMGLSRDFELPSSQKINISTGVEMPILHGVESAQDVFNRDRFSLDPNQMTFKFQVNMKF